MHESAAGPSGAAGRSGSQKSGAMFRFRVAENGLTGCLHINSSKSCKVPAWGYRATKKHILVIFAII
jgi:hypothetical protein